MLGVRLFACVVGATIAALAGASATSAGSPPERVDAAGIVYRYYPGYGYRFHPLMSFTHLEQLLYAKDLKRIRRLATALVARGVHRQGTLIWQYDFPYAGGPVPWTSGFVQADAADMLSRTSTVLHDRSFLAPAKGAFDGLRAGLVMPLGGGLWVREYGWTHQAILNSQLESLVSLELYRNVVKTEAARRVASQFYSASRALLPRFDLHCWSRYMLGGPAASRHYHAYHVDILRRLSRMHPGDSIWRATYLRWNRCLG